MQAPPISFRHTGRAIAWNPCDGTGARRSRAAPRVLAPPPRGSQCPRASPAALRPRWRHVSACTAFPSPFHLPCHFSASAARSPGPLSPRLALAPPRARPAQRSPWGAPPPPIRPAPQPSDPAVAAYIVPRYICARGRRTASAPAGRTA